MSFVNIADISLSFGNRDILENINLNISSNSKIALAGANGSGKTSLLKIISGITKPDKGSISAQKDTVISYLPQSGITYKGFTVFEEADKAFASVEQNIARISLLESELANCKEGEAKLPKLLDELHILQEKVLQSGYYERQSVIEQVLTGLGFSRDDFSRLTETFSGGWQMRIALARTLLENPDIMLLDEPTNYLDIEARNWLEEFLETFKGGYIIVSHDRFFLDVTCNEVLELFNGKLNRYKGNYSAYEKTRAQELESLIEKYERQQEEIARIELLIRRFRYKATKAAMVQSRIKQLEAMEIIVIPESLKKMHLKFPNPPHSGKDVVYIEALNKFYGSFQALKEINLSISRGEKVALTGKNGAGKSTLLKILSGTDSLFEGVVKYGKDVSIGYFSQDFESTLDNSNTVIEEVESVSPTELIPNLRNLLGAFLFRGDDIDKKISVLSGGEKNRIALLKLLLHPSNLLILDEPTNHLDLNSKDILLDALKSYSGTLIFVSHDRYFIENLATRVIELENGLGKDFPGDYSYYLWRKSQENSGTSQPVVSLNQPDLEKTKNQSSGISWEAEKAAKKERKKLEKKAAEIMEEIDKLDNKKSDFQHQMADPDVYSNGAKIKEIKEAILDIEKRQALLMQEWEDVEASLQE